MRLLINTATTFKGGGVEVARSFISECKKHFNHEYHVVLGLELAKLIDQSAFPANFHFYEIDYRPATKVFSFTDQASLFKELESVITPDVVFTTTGPAYWRPKAPHMMGFNLPHYIYSDSPFFNLLSFYKNMRWFLKGRVIKYFTKRDADAYVTQTDDVAHRLKRWIGKDDDVFTVTNTYGEQFRNVSKENNSNKGLYKLLVLSAYYPHKNLEIINEIAEIAEDNDRYDFKFILTIDDATFQKVFTNTAKNFIENIGAVKPEQCPSLYNKSNFVFLPTLLECFSANYAEGMLMERPIITTDLDFSRSICGDAALYFKPLDGTDAYQKIINLIADNQLQQKLIAKGKERLKNFRGPEERAERYLALCQKLVDRKNKTQRS